MLARLIVTVLCIAGTSLIIGLVGTPVARAHFTRPFLRQISGTVGAGGKEMPFSGAQSPGGVTVDQADNLWVSEPGPGMLDKFSPGYENTGTSGNSFLSSLGLIFEPEELKFSATVPQEVTFMDELRQFYVTGEDNREAFPPTVEVFDIAGKLLKRWNGTYQKPHVAVDNSTSPLDPSRCVMSECTAYVAHEKDDAPPYGDGQPRGITKYTVNAAGESQGVPFAESGNGYVEGDEIVGLPAADGHLEQILGVTAGPDGSIYVIAYVQTGEPGTFREAADVIMYSPSGKFVRLFTGEGSPGVGGSMEYGSEHGGFGGVPKSVAVDPVSGHLLVSVRRTQYVKNPSGGEVLEADESVIDEFDDATGKYVAQIASTSEPSSKLHATDAISTDSQGDVYVVDRTGEKAVEPERSVEVYGPGVYLPTVAIAEASSKRASSAVVSGTVNPENLSLSACAFQYTTQDAFEREGFTNAANAECEPAAGTIPADDEPHAVQAKLTGLASGTSYRYRLAARTAGALGGTSYSKPLAFTACHAPRIDATRISNLSSRFVDLYALINPLGAETSYHFEYDTNEYGAGEAPHGVSVPIPDASIGAGGPTGSEDVSVVQHAGSLRPGTTYHVRLVAVNEVDGQTEHTYGPDVAFTTLPVPSVGLPDGRAYELVTPSNKGSSADLFSFPEIQAQDFFNNDRGFASEDGEAFLLESQHATFGAFTATGANVYVFTRKIREATWSYRSVAPATWGVQNIVVPLFDPASLATLGLTDNIGATPSPEGSRATDIIGSAGGPYTVLHTDAPRHSIESKPGEERTTMPGGSRGLKMVVLESNNYSLCGVDKKQAHGERLCEWSGKDEMINGEARPELTLVSVNGEGRAFACGAVLGLTGDENSMGGTTHGAVSVDGTRVFFTAPDPYAVNEGAGCWNGATSNAPQVYMRSHDETIEISAPEAGVSEEGHRPLMHPAVFVGAAEDGSKVFFITETELTQDAASRKLHDPELYEYETETGNLTRVSAGEVGSAVRAAGSSGAHVYRVMAVAADGAAIYFTASGALVAKVSAFSEPQESNGPVNLYRYDTATGATSFIGKVDARDYPTSHSTGWWGAPLPPELALASNASWYATPDGRYLVFASEDELTGYSTVESPEAKQRHGVLCWHYDSLPSPSSGHCTEVYRYDAVSGEVVCVSCDPSGAPPVSNAFFAHSTGMEGPSVPSVAAMSTNGQYVFFDTADPLVSTDGNETLDVYEWHEGDLALISSGRDPAPSYFLGQSPADYHGEHMEAANVFFGTHANLAPADTDSAGDIYDARICTAIEPCIASSSAGTGQCEGGACQHPPTPPVDATPNSLTFFGPGNPFNELKAKPKRCTMGKVRRHGRCVKGRHPKQGKRRKHGKRDRRAQRAVKRDRRGSR